MVFPFKNRNMKKTTSTCVAAAVLLVGCASASKDVASAYVSPMQYQSYDCDQLASESQRVQVRVNQLAGQLDEAAANDKAITGVGMILFWPALFALGGKKPQEAEYSRLKGEYDALQQSATLKKCVGVVAPLQVPSQAATAAQGATQGAASTAAAPGSTATETAAGSTPAQAAQPTTAAK